jgi:DNA-binding beta-propeller fold protein YncE
MKPSVLIQLEVTAINFLICISLGIAGHAQDTIAVIEPGTSEIPRVKWVKQWPSADKKHKPRSFKDRFNSIFLGKQMPVLVRPVSVFAFNTENLWVLDQGARAVFSIQREVGDIPHYLQKSDFDFSSLVGICSIPSSGIFFTDSHAKKIYLVFPDKKKVQVLNDSLVLDQPTGIAYSALTNEIWVVETNAHRIAVLNDRGEIVRHIGERGTAPGEFNYPTHIWIDKFGLVYVVDAMNFRVQVLNNSGDVVSVFGQPGDASGYFARPKGIATDSRGNIYIVDALFHTIQVFNLQGKFLYNIGSQGQGEGEFWMPSGIFIDEENFIYIADSYNSRVQVFKLIFDNKQ